MAKYDSDKPEPIFNSYGRLIGYLQPKVKPENLGYGLQPWSKPEKESK